MGFVRSGMRRLTLLLLSLAGTAQAINLVPARVLANDIARDDDKLFAEAINYRTVAAEYPYLEVFSTTSLPNNQWFIEHCKKAVLNSLKSPATARFVSSTKTSYNTVGGAYFNGGKVDAQNSYGALLRGSYYCSSVYVGSMKGGTVYMDVDVNNK